MVKPLKEISILWRFYRSYAALSLIASAVFAYLYFALGFKTLGTLLWVKLFTDAVIMYYIHLYKKKEFYYFHNLGFTKKALWATTLSFDFIIFIIMVILIYHFPS